MKRVDYTSFQTCGWMYSGVVKTEARFFLLIEASSGFPTCPNTLFLIFLPRQSTVSAVMFNPSERHMVAAAVIVCGVMAALVVAASVLFFVRRHSRAKAKLPPYSSQDTEAKDYEVSVACCSRTSYRLLKL